MDCINTHILYYIGPLSVDVSKVSEHAHVGVSEIWLQFSSAFKLPTFEFQRPSYGLCDRYDYRTSSMCAGSWKPEENQWKTRQFSLQMSGFQLPALTSILKSEFACLGCRKLEVKARKLGGLKAQPVALNIVSVLWKINRKSEAGK